MPIRTGGFHVIPWTLAAAALGVLTFMAIGTESESAWECTPVDPLAPTLPANPCFRATVSLENRVTLEWRVVNSGSLVYIYDDFGPNYDDVGIKAAVCRSGAGDGCTTSFRVSEGGFYRWQLMAESSQGQRAPSARSHRVTTMRTTSLRHSFQRTGLNHS
jgi:hypothetical protein